MRTNVSDDPRWLKWLIGVGTVAYGFFLLWRGIVGAALNDREFGALILAAAVIRWAVHNVRLRPSDRRNSAFTQLRGFRVRSMGLVLIALAIIYEIARSHGIDDFRR